ncbi:MAG: type II secretion system protein [Verrucomicrobiota bacterium JB023]|nr:type II secretion system protein [Verrucomicrobiota bacterium JB023]
MKRAFTMPELLVVIAVIAALAGIAIPIGMGIYRKAQKVRCQSNLREIGLALDAYANDHRGNLPDLMSMRRKKNEDLPVLETVLSRYLTNPEVFRCPADKEFYQKSGSSYAWNHLVSGMNVNMMEFFGSEERSSIPLVGDKEAFHGKEDGTNLLYGDFRARDKVRFQTGGGALGHAR